jgi:hypothetical protein
MHLYAVRSSATKIPMASSFRQGKFEDYFSIQIFDLRGT